MSGKPNIIREKYFEFTVEVVKLCKGIMENKKEFVLSKQLMRSGTSIGANVRESSNAQSTADFIHKLSIAQKETDETLYWLELLKATGYISEEDFRKFYNECEELLKIIRSIILTTKQRTRKK